MPDIHFECPKCGQPLDAPDELVNQLIECPGCNETINVPTYSRRMKLPEPATASPLPTPERLPEFRSPVKPFAFGSGAAPTASAPLFDKLPEVEVSGVAIALTFFAVLEFIGAVIAGCIIGSGADSTGDGNPELGWLIFVCGVLSGLILLGFARVIEYSFQSAQRMRRIEMLIQKSHDDKRPPNTKSEGSRQGVL